MEEMLLENEKENEDITSFTHALRANIKINYDLNTLMKSEFVYDVDKEMINEHISDQEYLDIYRKRCETRIIKMKIIYKLYEGVEELTLNEKRYLNEWVKDLMSSKSRNLLNLRDSMV